MQVTANSVVTLSYKIRVDGKIVEQSPEEEPVFYIHGTNTLMSSVEKAIEGMAEGEQKKFTIEPEDAYGLRDASNVYPLPRSIFPPDVELTPGTRLAAKTLSDEIHPITVVSADPLSVIVDFNHPLAGKILDFSVKVLDVRPASDQEKFTGKPVHLAPSSKYLN